jgi:MFS family permease
LRYEIRAMSAGEILDTGFRLLCNHFVQLVGISAIVNVPLGIGQSLLEREAPTSVAGLTPMLIVIGLVIFVGVAVLLPIVQTAITVLLGDIYLGREASIGGAFRRALDIVFPLLGTGLLASLIAIPAFLALLIPGIWFVLGLAVLSPVMILERRFGMAAIRRSLELVKDNRMRALGITLIVAVLSVALGAGFGLVGGISPWLGGLATGIAGSLTSAFAAAVFVVLYFEIRCRKEAFAIEQLSHLVEAGAETRPTSGA